MWYEQFDIFKHILKLKIKTQYNLKNMNKCKHNLINKSIIT